MKSSKKIDISKASLVSLKAELSRKQDEVNKARAQGAFIHPVPHPKKQTLWTKKNAGVSERGEKDFEKEREEENIFKKSRAALEAKSKLYDKLSSQGEPTDDSKFLVDFQQKATDAGDEEDKPASDEYDSPSDPEEDWVDYVDCLGRTRRCLKKDLDYIKEKDAALFQSLGGEGEKQQESSAATTTAAEPELLSADMKREMMRQKWEEQEDQLRNKSDIHYQDVLFDEARSHGVGYYAFSQDETRRKTQQEALSKLRQQTQKQQEAARDVRDRRQALLQARVKAARRRKRERLGLPPEEEEEEQEVAPEVEETPEEKEETRPAEVKPAATKPAPVRPWDIGKEGVREVMSQEDWVKQKRTERPQEFAPPSTYQPDFIPGPGRSRQPQPKLLLSRRPGSDEDAPQAKLQKTSEEARGRGTEIPPPPTFEYYGPASTSRARSVATPKDLEDSITAGLKYLRKQAEEREQQREKGLLGIL